jgi:hypothetical protein
MIRAGEAAALEGPPPVSPLWSHLRVKEGHPSGLQVSLQAALLQRPPHVLPRPRHWGHAASLSCLASPAHAQTVALQGVGAQLAVHAGKAPQLRQHARQSAGPAARRSRRRVGALEGGRQLAGRGSRQPAEGVSQRRVVGQQRAHLRGQSRQRSQLNGQTWPSKWPPTNGQGRVLWQGRADKDRARPSQSRECGMSELGARGGARRRPSGRCQAKALGQAV